VNDVVLQVGQVLTVCITARSVSGF